MEHLKFGGFMGVELFFVLSGFLIGRILLKLAREGSVHWLRGFYIRRWFRTLPNYYLFVFINVGLVLLAVRPGSLDVFWQYLFFAQNLFTPHPLFFPEAWSLAVEEIFYLLFPAFFLLIGRAFRLEVGHAMLLAALIVIGLSLMARAVVSADTQSWDEDIRKIVFLRFDTLMFGVLLAWLHDRGSRLVRWFWPAWMAVLIFVASSVYFAMMPATALNDSFFAKTIFFSAASLGCAGLISVGLNWKLPLLLTEVSEFLARISYSAYLVNIPVAILLVKAGIGEIGGLGAWLLFMTATLALSHLLYQTYERRFNAWRDRSFPA
jgi:peptidoglycan/LPS O-acetylase OafA/YrhL